MLLRFNQNISSLTEPIYYGRIYIACLSDRRRNNIFFSLKIISFKNYGHDSPLSCKKTTTMRNLSCTIVIVEHESYHYKPAECLRKENYSRLFMSR